MLNKFLILKQLSVGKIIILNTIPSTNQYLIDNIRYMQSGDVVVTENQTKGRGRLGRIWITPKNQGICLSMYWKLYKRPLNVMELSWIISSMVGEVLEKFGSPKLTIKWPNDIYIYNRKLSGILIEIIRQSHSIFHVIIGIGINISICLKTKLEIEMSKNWIDLNYIGIFPNRSILCINLIKNLRAILNQFESDNDISRIYYK